jgi:hypothetical protein
LFLADTLDTSETGVFFSPSNLATSMCALSKCLTSRGRLMENEKKNPMPCSQMAHHPEKPQNLDIV